MRWPVFAVLIVVAVIAHEPVSAAMPRTIRWVPEERLTLHEGDTAIIEVAPGEARLGGSAGDAVKLIKTRHRHGTTIFTYRAVRPGNYTIIAALDKLGPGGCISCVTVHYFATVVP